MKWWWNSTCTRKKRKVKKEYIKWKNGTTNKDAYIKERKELRMHCIEKEKEFKENEAAELRSIKNESEVWKSVACWRVLTLSIIHPNIYIFARD